MNDCLFCKIIAGEVPSDKVYEDDIALAFLDINPNNPGHTLVIPKEHSTNIFDIDENILSHLATVNKKIAIAQKEALGAEGVNVYANNERAAGQVVFHTHIHIIPRYEKDDYKVWSGNPENAKNNPEVADKLKKAL